MRIEIGGKPHGLSLKKACQVSSKAAASKVKRVYRVYRVLINCWFHRSVEWRAESIQFRLDALPVPGRLR